jgi:hypothetical protein
MFAAKRRLIFAGLASAALIFAIVGTATAHHVTTPGCGQVVFASTSKGWQAIVNPGNVVFGPFTQNGDNGPYDIAPGKYTYQYQSPVDGGGWKNQESGSFTVVPCSTPSPTPTSSNVGLNPTPTPFDSFAGETATPDPSSDPTPPPTGTAGDNSSSGGSGPLFALLISVLFGGLGLTAAQYQRRSVRR